MANIKKTFNFRNGVQVDEDNLIVNATGLVGIGTTIPTEPLDVRGTAKVVGLVTSQEGFVGVFTAHTSSLGTVALSTSIIGAGVSIKSGIITSNSATGLVTYYGDARFLQGMPTSQWEDTDAGFGVTSIFNTGGTVGIATTNPQFSLQVGNNVNGGEKGVGISSVGHIKASGIITATTFSGNFNGSVDSSALNATGVSTFTGISTFNSDVYVEATTDTNQLHVSGVSTFNQIDLKGTAGTGNADSYINSIDGDLFLQPTGGDVGVIGNFVTTGDFTATGRVVGMDYAQFNSLRCIAGVTTLGVTTFTGAVSIGDSISVADNKRIYFGDDQDLSIRHNEPGHSYIQQGSGKDLVIQTGVLRIVNTADNQGLAAFNEGSFVGLYYAGTERLKTSGVGVTVYNQLDTTNLSISGVSTFTGVVNANGQVKVGTGGTAFTTLATGQAGIGTATPTTDFQVRKSNGSKIEVVADSGVAQVSIGQTVGAGSSVGYIRYGSINKGLEFINNDTGNLNMVLHNGPAGLGTGRFDWKYGQSNNELMSLTYDGKLGINQTAPINTLHVVGTSTVTSHAYVGGNLSVGGNISGTFNWPSVLTGTNLNNTSGISTFYDINVTRKVGISSALPAVDFDAKGKTALFGGIGINTTQNNLYGNQLLVQGNATFASTVGFGTTAPNTDIVGSTGLIQVHNNDIVIRNGGINIDATSASYIGIGTTSARACVDFSMVGGIGTTGYMLPPVITTAAQVGLTTEFGGIVYNSSTNKLQCYTPTGWQDLF